MRKPMTTDDGDELVDFDLIDRSKCQHCWAHITECRCGLHAALAPPDKGESASGRGGGGAKC
jgi:hypothetical protein